MTLGVLAFVLAFGLSIMLHEAGHFVTARAFGMKATQFFLGFGPTLWSRRRGEVEYGVKAIPAGGFVKIVGMTPLEEVDPADEPRAMYRQPAPQRAVVLSAGSVVHFLIALVLLFLVLVAVGLPDVSPRISQVSRCVPASASADPSSAADCAGLPPSPARAAGIRPGDVLVSFDGRPVKDWDATAAAIRKHGPGTATLVVERDGARVTLHPTLAAQQQTEKGKTRTVGVLGVTPSEVAHRYGPLTAARKTFVSFGQLFTATFSALGHLPSAVSNLFHSTFGNAQRSADGLMGPVGIARVSGQAFAQQTPWFERIGTFLLVIAGLNVFVGIFNLLPLLPLDGGHLAVLGYEEARKRLYRLFGRRDPGRVDLNRLLPAAYLVLTLFVGLSVLLLFSDVVDPIKNPFGG